MKIPAAMASNARITLKPPSDMNADRPVRISHMANKRNPMFLLNLIPLLLDRCIRNFGLPFSQLVRPRIRAPTAQPPVLGRAVLIL